MTKNYDAVISGYFCVDFIAGFKKNETVININDLLRPGKLIEIEGMSYTLGGVVANAGMALKKFNKNVFLNGLIGDDFIGKMARDYLDNCELSEGIKSIANAGTAFGLVIAPPGVDRIFLESPGCSSMFDIDYIDLNIIGQSRLFHFGYPPLLKQFYINDGAQLSSLFSTIKAMGVMTSLDFSLPDLQSESGKINWQKLLKDVLPFTDIFVPSLEEALLITMPEQYTLLRTSGDNDIIDRISFECIREIGKQIVDAGVKILLIKAGHRGAYLRTGEVASINEQASPGLQAAAWNNQELWCDAYPVDASRFKNASGAGDTASAAFLSAILDGENPDTALRYAAVAGRNNLYCNDIYNELSSWEEMTLQIQSDPVRVFDMAEIKENHLSDAKQVVKN